MGATVDEVVRQRPAQRITPAIGQFGLQDAGGAGAEEDADATFSVTGNRFPNALGKAIGFQAELHQPVIAAIVARQIFWQFLRVDRNHFTDPGIESDRFENTGPESAAPLTQASQRRLKAAAKAGGGGVTGNMQRGHGGPRIHQTPILTRQRHLSAAFRPRQTSAVATFDTTGKPFGGQFARDFWAFEVDLWHQLTR